MFHGCQPWADFINKQTSLHRRIGSGERIQFFLRYILRRDHHPARILQQEWTAEFELSLLVEFQIMLNMLTHTFLLAEVNTVLPLGTRLMKDNITNRAGIGHSFLL